MTVYVVMESHLEVHRINTIFVSKVLAEKQIEQLKTKKKKYIDQYDWWIEKHEVFGE
jgi:hypothetical protein